MYIHIFLSVVNTTLQLLYIILSKYLKLCLYVIYVFIFILTITFFNNNPQKYIHRFKLNKIDSPAISILMNKNSIFFINCNVFFPLTYADRQTHMIFAYVCISFYIKKTLRKQYGCYLHNDMKKI